MPTKTTLRSKVIKEMIAEQEYQIVKNQIAKEYQMTLDTAEAKKQVKAAEFNIDQCLDRLDFLKKLK